MEQADLHWLDWLVVGLYIVFIVWLGLRYTKKAGKDLTGFFLSGRSLPWWLAGTSVIAGHFSVSQPVKITSMVRMYGIEHCWIQWYAVPASLLGAVFLSRFWRRAKIITPVELYRTRFTGPSAHFLTVFHSTYNGIFMRCFFIGMSYIALEKLLIVILPEGFSPIYIIVAVSLVAVAYTICSGLYAVVITDFIQFLIATLGLGMLVTLIYLKTGGPSAMLAQIAEMPGKENNASIIPSLPAAGASLKEKLLFVDFLVYIGALWLFNHSLGEGGTDTQRIMGSRNERNAMFMIVWSNIVERGLIFWLYIIIGLGSLVLLGGDEFDHQAAYPAMGLYFLPIGLKGLFMAAIIAALMSSIDTGLNSAASYMVNDLYKNYFVKNQTDRHYVLAARVATALLMLLAFLLWYYGMRGTTILNNFKKITMFMAGASFVNLLHWFWWRVNGWSLISAMLGSALFTWLLGWVLPAQVPWFAEHNLTTTHYPIGMLLIVLLTALIWLPVTLLSPPVQDKQLIEFYRQVRPMGFWKHIKEATGNLDTDHFTKADLFCWITVLSGVFCFIFGVGKLLLGSYLTGLALIACFAALMKAMLYFGKQTQWWHGRIPEEPDKEEDILEPEAS